MKIPALYLVIPCFNEQEVLPVTSKIFLSKIESLISLNKISDKSKIMLVDDGSTDSTWKLIKEFAEHNSHFVGVALSRNRGHQNALLAGLMEAKSRCDITISIDCDGQDDINAVDMMIDEYKSGSEIVYGVRSDRSTDTWFKRTTAQGFYKLLKNMGVETVYNHADYRLMSSRALNEFSNFKEVNIFLRGMVPLIGFKSSCVSYERKERIAGKSHYPLKKMMALAFDGITSLSIKPIRIIASFGFVVSVISFIFIVWSIIRFIMGATVAGWASIISIVCFFSGIQLLSLGVIGEYIGKIYMESKARPRFIIKDRTDIE